MKHINHNFKFKGDKYEPPSNYLGARLRKRTINRYECWTMSSYNYIQAAIQNVEDKLQKSNSKLPRRAPTPMESGYRPELDGSEELNASDTQYFQELIGVLRWATELGRVDILTEIAMLSSFQANPRQGHIEQIFHIFAFLKHNPKLSLYFDPAPPQLDPSIFQYDIESFREHYRDAHEEQPFKMPEPLGRAVTTTAYVDASHAANKTTRRSHTGYILFVNKAPISYYSKRQNTVESSTFSSEFIAMKTCIESIHSLRYKL